MVVPDFIDDSEKDGSGEWEPEPFFPFTIEPFPSSEDQVDPEIVERRVIVPQLDVRRTKGTEIAFGRCWFGPSHDIGKPVRERFDRRGEGQIVVEPTEGFIR